MVYRIEWKRSLASLPTQSITLLVINTTCCMDSVAWELFREWKQADVTKWAPVYISGKVDPSQPRNFKLLHPPRIAKSARCTAQLATRSRHSKANQQKPRFHQTYYFEAALKIQVKPTSKSHCPKLGKHAFEQKSSEFWLSTDI